MWTLLIIFLLSLMLDKGTSQSTTLFLDSNPRDSGIYKGEVKRGVPHGEGTVTYFFDDEFKRRKYTGDWKNGTRWGEGTTVWRNGTVYTGTYVNGLEQGLGSLKSNKSPRIYQGEFAGGQRHGKGVVTEPDGRRLKGTWTNGRLVGNLSPLIQELPEPIGEIQDIDLTEKLLSQVDQTDIGNSPGLYSRDVNADNFRFIEILRRTDSRFGRKSRSVTKELLQKIYDHVNKSKK